MNFLKFFFCNYLVIFLWMLSFNIYSIYNLFNNYNKVSWFVVFLYICVDVMLLISAYKRYRRFTNDD